MYGKSIYCNFYVGLLLQLGKMVQSIEKVGHPETNKLIYIKTVYNIQQL